MTVGELAKRVGVAPSKLRFLEAAGLLKPQRMSNGYRSYSEASVSLTNTILQAQSFGFTLAEITAAFGESGGNQLRCEPAIKAMQSKLMELEAHMQQLRTLRRRIRQTMKELQAQKGLHSGAGMEPRRKNKRPA